MPENAQTFNQTHVGAPAHVEERRKPFLHTQLPLTFQHAIEVTHCLGFNHIWIDCLCISQDENYAKEMEMAKMGNIYMNSALTIASHIGDHASGCFNEHSVSNTTRNKGSTSLVRGQTIDGRLTRLLFIWDFTGDENEPSDIQGSELQTRGWIFQERILSPRTVHFTRNQVVWECRTKYLDEDMIYRYRATTKAGSLAFSEFKTAHVGYQAGPNDPPKMSEEAGKVERATRNRWYADMISSEFSKRNFTCYDQGDRLNAIVGVARIFQRTVPDPYLAGLWQADLAYGLAWSHWLPSGSRRSEELLKPRNPSWSWTSHNYDVHWRGRDDFVPSRSFKFVQDCLQYSVPDQKPFCGVAGGYICVLGYRLAACVREDCQKIRIEKRWYAFYMDDPGKQNRERVSKTALFALVLGHRVGTNLALSNTQAAYFLIMERVLNDKHAFRRLGTARQDFRYTGSLGFWDNPANDGSSSAQDIAFGQGICRDHDAMQENYQYSPSSMMDCQLEQYVPDREWEGPRIHHLY